MSLDSQFEQFIRERIYLKNVSPKKARLASVRDASRLASGQFILRERSEECAHGLPSPPLREQ